MFTQEEVKEIRTRHQLTQAAFAEKVGVSTVLVAMTETGQKPVSRHYLQKIANAFGEPIKITIRPKHPTLKD